MVNLEKLPPEERIKKLKELERKRKEEIKKKHREKRPKDPGMIAF